MKGLRLVFVATTHLLVCGQGIDPDDMREVRVNYAEAESGPMAFLTDFFLSSSACVLLPGNKPLRIQSCMFSVTLPCHKLYCQRVPRIKSISRLVLF